MRRLCFLFCLLYPSYNLAYKDVLIKEVRCNQMGLDVDEIVCKRENNRSISLNVKARNDLNSLVGVSNINIYKYGFKNVMRLNGLRSDFCKTLSYGKRINLLGLLNEGIMKSSNNLPKSCPFKGNITYIMENMQFDGNYLPAYLPEYNYTYVGKFYTNDMIGFEVRVNGSFCNSNHDCMHSI